MTVVVGGGDVGSGSELVGDGAELVGAGARWVDVLDLELEVGGATERLSVELLGTAADVAVGAEAAVTVGVALCLRGRRGALDRELVELGRAAVP